MIEINLLPKEYQKKAFKFSLGKTGLYAMGAAAAVVVMLIAVTFYQRSEIANLNENIDKARNRATMLRKDIQLVDALTDVKAKITNRMEAVEKLDRNRSVWVRILEEVARDVPEFVWLAQFNEIQEKSSSSKSKKGKKKKKKDEEEQAEAAPKRSASTKRIQLEGHAFTLNALAAFMINMMRSDYFDNVEMLSTSEVEFDKHRAYKFVLNSDLHFLSDEELRKKIAQAPDDKSKTGHKSLN